MKTILSIISAFMLLQSCAVGDKQEVAADSTLLERDTSITSANSYSDLFLDSTAISSFIQQQKLDGVAAARLRNFYNVRNNQFAWFYSGGLTEEGRNFWALWAGRADSSGSKTSESRDSSMIGQRQDTLIQKDSIRVAATDTAFINRELALTRAFIQWAESNEGSINTANMYYIVPAKRMDPMAMADSVLQGKNDTAFASDKVYGAMKQQLAVYYNAAKSGGWEPITSAAELKKGSKSAAVSSLKKRLSMTNDYPASDTSNVFSDSLVTAIKDVQQRNGLAATGRVNDSLVSVLNIPATERLQQLLVNMNRMKWMPYAAGGDRIEVNLPSQMLYAWEGDTAVLEMPVIIGDEGTGTVSFSGEISKVVFNPEWNIPESIVRKEIMPAMKTDPAYLRKHNMELVRQNDSVPVIRQLPGKDNPLGKVKFLFPNNFDIYLHDTPDKLAFKRKDRALSHGCIRVADAQKLAAYVLRDQKEWTPEKIREAMNSNKEQVVAVSGQPVQINYYSAWADASGKVHFRNDINGRDKKLFARMFNAQNTGDDVAGSLKPDSTSQSAAKTAVRRSGNAR